jgi:small subunit ribosomal protein S6
MPANVYECMFLLDTNRVAGDHAGAAKQLHAILERNNAEVLASRPWEERKLAYPIKNHKKGLYYLTYFRTEGKNLVNIEHDLQLNETVLRNMILRVDPKLVDMMLQVARDERAMALQTVNEPPADEDLGGGREEERGPRRTPRHRPGPPTPPAEPDKGD